MTALGFPPKPVSLGARAQSCRLRVLVTASTFPVHLDDGRPRFVFDLADSLAKHADVTVLAPDSPGALQTERIGHVDVSRFTYFLPRSWQCLAASAGNGMRENFRNSWLAAMQLPPFLGQQIRATRALVKSRQIDVINAHWIIPQGLTAALAIGRRRTARLVLHVHAGDVYLLQKLRFGRQLARFVVGRCSHIIADGSHVRDSLNDLVGFDSGAVIQSMGVNRDIFSPDVRRDSVSIDEAVDFPNGYLLFVGRFVEKKGVTYLVRAMQTILERHPGLGLLLVGNGPEEEALKQQVSTLGLGNSIRFLGRKPHSEIIRYLHGCRLAIVPSIIDSLGETEGMPTVVVEAMAAGVPVVGSRVDGIPDVIRHEENGWLCREKDPTDLAEKILDGLTTENTDAIVQQALITAENYDWQQVANNYMSWIRDDR
jgi:glycosyltransferase involved in cell wall biosynthesis